MQHRWWLMVPKDSIRAHDFVERIEVIQVAGETGKTPQRGPDPKTPSPQERNVGAELCDAEARFNEYQHDKDSHAVRKLKAERGAVHWEWLHMKDARGADDAHDEPRIYKRHHITSAAVETAKDNEFTMFAATYYLVGRIRRVVVEAHNKIELDSLTRTQLPMLTAIDRWKMPVIAGKAVGCDHYDLLSEAVAATLVGNRTWKDGTNFYVHLVGAMRSIAWCWLHKKGEEIAQSDLWGCDGDSPADVPGWRPYNGACPALSDWPFSGKSPSGGRAHFGVPHQPRPDDPLVLDRPEGSSRRQPASAWLYKQLERKIVGGELEPGREFPEARIAKVNHVSQSAVRESLGCLEQRGLVTRAHRTTTVIKLEHDVDFYDRLRLRMALEPAALMDAAYEMTPTSIAELRSQAEGMRSDPTGERDYRWHETVGDYSGNKPFADALVRTVAPVYVAHWRSKRVVDNKSRLKLPPLGLLPKPGLWRRTILGPPRAYPCPRVFARSRGHEGRSQIPVAAGRSRVFLVTASDTGDYAKAMVPTNGRPRLGAQFLKNEDHGFIPAAFVCQRMMGSGAVAANSAWCR